MPLHDWTRVPAGLFHDFHQSWSIRIKDALNAGILPPGMIALVEQRSGPVEADVLAIEGRRRDPGGESTSAATATLEAASTAIVRRSSRQTYATRANRIVVRHHLGRIVAVVEIVSPGNKDSRAAFRNFLDKTVEFVQAGVHLLLVDLFPPSPRDPQGLHKALWDEVAEVEDFLLPKDRNRLVVSYANDPDVDLVAHIEPVAVGDKLPDTPLFLGQGLHVKVPLESTYLATWDALPEEFRSAVETGVLPDADAT